MKLLERSTRGIKLTEAGKFFADEAGAVLARADEAVQAVRALVAARSVNSVLVTRLRRQARFSQARWRHFRRLRQGCA